MTRPTMEQIVYINDLYSKKNTPYSKRVVPRSEKTAATLIRKLRKRASLMDMATELRNGGNYGR